MTLTRRSPPIAATEDAPSSATLLALGQRLRFGLWICAAALWTLPAALVQAVLLVVPGEAKRGFARHYWSVMCRILGVERRVLGRVARRDGRGLLYICNHTSWLDIPALGGTLPACFVAKAEVGQWPVIRIIARLGRTEFVSRRASDTGRERDSMRARLASGDDLILFPEGTSSDGARVLPFRSPFFSIAEASDGTLPPLVQPVSIVFDRLDFLPTGRASRPVSSWYGDMELGSHFWQLARHKQLRVTILLHPAVDPTDYPSRKALASAVWAIVADGCAALRQNRPVAATADSLDRTTAIIGTVNAG